jgi:hypothetical protein
VELCVVSLNNKVEQCRTLLFFWEGELSILFVRQSTNISNFEKEINVIYKMHIM